MRMFIVIKSERTYRKIFVDKIIYCKAEGSYSKIYLNNNKELLFAKLLKEIETLLADYNYFRINRSYLVNLDHCFEILSGEKPILVLSNDVKLCISLPKMKLFRKRFCTHS